MFTRAQFAVSRPAARHPGKFVLSINDTPEMRETFAGFVLEEVALKNSISAAVSTEVKEPIISNF